MFEPDSEGVELPPAWAIPLRYERLLENLRTANTQIRKRDYEGKTESLSRASAIVFELLTSLDREHGGELAGRLAALYSYFAGEIQVVGRSLDTAHLERLINMIASLHASWVQAAAEMSPGRPE